MTLKKNNKTETDIEKEKEKIKARVELINYSLI